MKKGGCIFPVARSVTIAQNFSWRSAKRTARVPSCDTVTLGVIYRLHQQLRRPSGNGDAPQRNVDIASSTEIRLLAVGGTTGRSRESAGRELSDRSSVRIHAEETRLATAFREARKQNVAVGAGGDRSPRERSRQYRSSACFPSLDRSFRYSNLQQHRADGPPWPRRWCSE